MVVKTSSLERVEMKNGFGFESAEVRNRNHRCLSGERCLKQSERFPKLCALREDVVRKTEKKKQNRKQKKKIVPKSQKKKKERKRKTGETNISLCGPEGTSSRRIPTAEFRVISTTAAAAERKKIVNFSSLFSSFFCFVFARTLRSQRKGRKGKEKREEDCQECQRRPHFFCLKYFF